MDTRFKPKPGPRLGGQPIALSQSYFNALTANGNTTFLLPHPGRKCALQGAVLRIGALATPATPGTLIATLYKHSVVDNAEIALTGAINLLASGLAANAPISVPLLGLSDHLGTCNPEDTLYLVVTSNNATISVQPGQLTLALDALLLN